MAQKGCGLAQLGSSVAQLGCGVAQLLVRQLAVQQARVRFLAQHPMEASLAEQRRYKKTCSVAFEALQLCRTSSTFVKVCPKSSISLVKMSAGVPKTFSDTSANWSCVTRCGCRTTSSTLFTV